MTSTQLNNDLSQNETNETSKGNTNHSKPLRFLGRSQIEMIDEALEAVGSFGEVQLIVEKGLLRFVITKNSHDALRWNPGDIED